MQFFQTAVDIQDKLIEFCMKEEIIPKKYRFIYAIPIIQTAQELVDNIVDANTIYVKSNEDAIERRRYQQRASGDCEKLLQKLQSLRRVRKISGNKMEEVAGMIISEKGYITAWRKSDNKRYREMRKENSGNAGN